MKKKGNYVCAMVLLVLVYLLLQVFCDWSKLTETITAGLAIVAAISFWLELRHTEQINEAQLIMELNNQFISNPQLTKVEWELEKYHFRYLQLEQEGGDKSTLKLDMDFSIEREQRQDLVNYLVHLEGVAALVNEGVLHLDTITNLMAYRFFIAVNNPCVQDIELIPYADYYQGCFKLCKKWSKEIPQEKIPMVEYSWVTRIEKENR